MAKRTGSQKEPRRRTRKDTSQQAPVEAPPTAPDPTPEAAPEAALEAVPEPAPVYVLVAEDEPAIAEILALILAEAGYTALLAANGREALNLAHTDWPALIITDLMMPQLDGGGLIAGLRAAAATEGRPIPPIIVMTAFKRLLQPDMAPDAVLIKPFDLADLLALLERFLGKPGTPLT